VAFPWYDGSMQGGRAGSDREGAVGASGLLLALLGGHPDVGQEFGPLVNGPARGEARVEIGEVGAGVVTCGAGGRDEREHVREADGAAARAREEPRLAARRDRPFILPMSVRP